MYWLKHSIWTFILVLVLLPKALPQSVIEFSGALDIEAGQGGQHSHYYYNGIHPRFSDFRLAPLQADLLASVNLNKQWSIHGRVQLRRDRGREWKDLSLAQANIRWTSKDELWKVSAGRILIPFGAFYDRLLSADRDFIEPPLVYSYYTNVSSLMGFPMGFLDTEVIRVDGRGDWGETSSYKYGYTNGLKLHKSLASAKGYWELALSHAAPLNRGGAFSEPIHPTIIARVQFEPVYFWKQGFSVSHGGFMQSSPVNNELSSLSRYTQSRLGMDFILGYTFFEFFGELSADFYRLPVYDNQAGAFVREGSELLEVNPWSFNLHLDAKYEMPFVSGAYLAYRFAYLSFSSIELPSEVSDIAWDRNVYRHAFALGYNLTDNILLKSVYTVQEISGRNWELNTWRNTLTLHF